jgi:hypothetical protein
MAENTTKLFPTTRIFSESDHGLLHTTKGKVSDPGIQHRSAHRRLVYMLDQLNKEGRLPPLPVYVDSPLSTNGNGNLPHA